MKNIHIENDEAVVVLNDNVAIVTKISNINAAFISKLTPKILTPEESKSITELRKLKEELENSPTKAERYENMRTAPLSTVSDIGNLGFDYHKFEIDKFDADDYARIANYFKKNFRVITYTGYKEKGEPVFRTVDGFDYCQACFDNDNLVEAPAHFDVILDNFGRIWKSTYSMSVFYDVEKDYLDGILDGTHDVWDGPFSLTCLKFNISRWATVKNGIKLFYLDLLSTQRVLNNISADEYKQKARIDLSVLPDTWIVTR